MFNLAPKLRKNHFSLAKYRVSSIYKINVCREPLIKLYFKLTHTLTTYPATQVVYAFVQLMREAYQTLDYAYFLRLLNTFQASDCKEITRYISTLREDLEAIKSSFFYTYNTSIVEGQINRLKMIKRLMYGRSSLVLLEKRVLMSD